jgi:nitrous oxidase accessory protein NosD
LFSAAPSLVAATLCVNPGGTGGCKKTISAAVTAAFAGDIIQVASGTYKENVILMKSVSLVAGDHQKPVIDAQGLNNGIFVNGMSAMPNAGVSGIVISGFEVENADYEGILIANASDITVRNNHVHDNDRALDISAGTCNGIPEFETNEGLDCGEGIHLMGVQHAFIMQNDVGFNAGGILISDETGPSHQNLISGNDVHDNPYDCGITMASHAPAVSNPLVKVSFGVTNNTVAGNISNHNGYQVPGAGAGVGIFAPFPGTKSASNTVIANRLTNNGQPGVTMHNHAWAPPPAPGVSLDDNVIVGNYIAGNAADAADAATPGPTGINLYSVGPVWGTIVSENVIEDETVGIAFKAPKGRIDAHLNNFLFKGIGADNLGSGILDATENWWKCPKGPGANGCATAAGDVWFTPWLTTPFVPVNPLGD